MVAKENFHFKNIGYREHIPDEKEYYFAQTVKTKLETLDIIKGHLETCIDTLLKLNDQLKEIYRILETPDLSKDYHKRVQTCYKTIMENIELLKEIKKQAENKIIALEKDIKNDMEKKFPKSTLERKPN